MFGYVRICKPELRIKEYEMYKALYCSLCREMGRRYGRLTRLTLSYDLTFLALLTAALSEKSCRVTAGRCCCNLLKKCRYCEGETDFSLSAAAGVVLAYYKTVDDIADEKGIRRLGARMLRGLLRRAHRKAAGDFPFLEEAIAAYIREQREAEAAGADLDHAADPTARLLSGLLEKASPEPSQQVHLHRLGDLLGRYIYLADCVADAQKDEKKGRFNPLLQIREPERSRCATRQLNLLIYEMTRSFEALEIRKFKNILGNILYAGLEDTVQQLQNPGRHPAGSEAL